MTFTDYLIDISLIALVLVQVKSRRLTVKALLLPIGIVAYVAFTYLKGVPTAHNDLVLIVVVADDHVDAVAIRALLGLAPAIELVGRRADRAVALAAGPLDLEPALAAVPSADRVIVDRRVEAEVKSGDRLAYACEGREDLIESRDLRFHGFLLC